MAIEAYESKEAGWFDDIKKEIKELAEQLVPYREISNKTNEIFDDFYEIASERSSKWEWLEKKKKWTLKFKDRDWKDCLINISQKSKVLSMEWSYTRKCITVKTWEKLYTLNWDIKSWLWKEPMLSQVMSISSHFYLTDKNWNITKDNLTPEEAADVYHKILDKYIDYRNFSRKEVNRLTD